MGRQRCGRLGRCHAKAVLPYSSHVSTLLYRLLPVVPIFQLVLLSLAALAVQCWERMTAPRCACAGRSAAQGMTAIGAGAIYKARAQLQCTGASSTQGAEQLAENSLRGWLPKVPDRPRAESTDCRRLQQAEEDVQSAAGQQLRLLAGAARCPVRLWRLCGCLPYLHDTCARLVLHGVRSDSLPHCRRRCRLCPPPLPAVLATAHTQPCWPLPAIHCRHHRLGTGSTPCCGRGSLPRAGCGACCRCPPGLQT